MWWIKQKRNVSLDNLKMKVLCDQTDPMIFHINSARQKVLHIKKILTYNVVSYCILRFGRIGGKQIVSLATGCLYDYIIWHELMHALGLEHEHQRPDRDRFIQIQYQNVDPDKLVNFEKISSRDVDLYHDYDYYSIMHYDGRAFGRLDHHTQRSMITMVPLKDGVELNDNLVLTSLDAEKLRILGKCEQDHQSSEDLSNELQTNKISMDMKPHKYVKRAPSVQEESNKTFEESLENISKSNVERINESLESITTTTTLATTTATLRIATINSINNKTCKDRSTECPRFKEKNYCNNYRYKSMVVLYCAETCGFCLMDSIESKQ